MTFMKGNPGRVPPAPPGRFDSPGDLDTPDVLDTTPARAGEILEITLHGRGGQGAQVACQILADAFFRSGRWVQAFAAYGGERRGAPVRACLRVHDDPIRVRCDVVRPHHAIVLDPTLLPPAGGALVRPGGLVIVNSAAAPCRLMPNAERVVAIDLADIAARAGLGPIVATAALGAFAGTSALVALDALLRAVEAGSPSAAAANIAACRSAYAEAANLALGAAFDD